jgi:hypothetical protein
MRAPVCVVMARMVAPFLPMRAPICKHQQLTQTHTQKIKTHKLVGHQHLQWKAFRADNGNWLLIKSGGFFERVSKPTTTGGVTTDLPQVAPMVARSVWLLSYNTRL